MDWKREAINDLSQLRKREHAMTAIPAIPAQIAELQEDFVAIRGVGGGVPVQGGGSRHEDLLLSNIVKREKLEGNLAAVKRMTAGIYTALETLDTQERRALEVLVVDRQHKGVDRLMGEWNYEKAHIYRIRERALYHFTIARYGVSEA